MKEQLISFETAKLAKEKGFNHIEANCYGDNMCYQLPEGDLINAIRGNTVAGYILTPTQSLLQKWLRDVHNIILVAFPYTTSTTSNNKDLPLFIWMIYKVTASTKDSFAFDSYEEALEQGLQAALKLI